MELGKGRVVDGSYISYTHKMIHTIKRYLYRSSHSHTCNVNLISNQLWSYIILLCRDIWHPPLLPLVYVVSSKLIEAQTNDLDTSPNLESSITRLNSHLSSIHQYSVYTVAIVIDIATSTYPTVWTIDNRKRSGCHIQTYCLIHIQPIILQLCSIAEDTWRSRLIYPFMQGPIVYL